MNTPKGLRARIRRLTPITIAAMAMAFAPSLAADLLEVLNAFNAMK